MTDQGGKTGRTAGVGIDWWAWALVLFGGYWLLAELEVVPMAWGLLGPLAVLTVGLAMATGRRGGCC